MSYNSIAKRIVFYLVVGLTVYFIAAYQNEKRINKVIAEAAPPVEFIPTPVSTVVAESEATGKSKADEAVAAAIAVTETIEVAKNPIVENQQEEDRILLHSKDMSGDEVSLTDDVARVVLDDYSELRKVFLGDVSISDRYRVVNPQEEAEYGIGEYEYVLHYKNKCEIAEVSVNYRNSNEPRVLGYRRC